MNRRCNARHGNFSNGNFFLGLLHGGRLEVRFFEWSRLSQQSLQQVFRHLSTSTCIAFLIKSLVVTMGGKGKRKPNRTAQRSQAAAAQHQQQQNTSESTTPQKQAFIDYFNTLIDSLYTQDSTSHNGALPTHPDAIAEVYRKLKDWKPNPTKSAWKKICGDQKKARSAQYSKAIKKVHMRVGRLMKNDGAKN